LDDYQRVVIYSTVFFKMQATFLVSVRLIYEASTIVQFFPCDRGRFYSPFHFYKNSGLMILFGFMWDSVYW